MKRVVMLFVFQLFGDKVIRDDVQMDVIQRLEYRYGC